MNIRLIEEQHVWDMFVHMQNPPTFLHAWQWGELQQKLGVNIERIGLYENNSLTGIALALYVRARRGLFLFCPHGPLVQAGAGAPQRHEVLLRELIRRAQAKRCAFVRISPLEQDTADTRKRYATLGFHNAPMHMHAETMWLLNIQEPEETLRKNMRKTTRNLIGRAERDGVTVRISTNEQDLLPFLKIYRETAQREQFVPFSESFLRAEYETFIVNGEGFLVFAEQGGDVLATALIITCGTTGFYHQGASSRKKPKIPAAYLLQWEVIRELQRQQKRCYNFWGITPTENPAHPWHGLTRFKQGYGGYQQNYLHAQDLPLTPLYWGIYLFERLRRIYRRL